ncbi:MAG: hypothetical protein PHC61_01050, partial [Chitinivibrionales bacterium]|nr:hypothetical protein [Chitinivibrionales bacterium]
MKCDSLLGNAILAAGVFLCFTVSLVAGQDTSAVAGTSLPENKTAAKSLKPTMAIIGIKNGSGVNKEDVELLTDRLNSELFKTDFVTVLERAEIDNILKEQGFQQSGACTDNQCM